MCYKWYVLSNLDIRLNMCETCICILVYECTLEVFRTYQNLAKNGALRVSTDPVFTIEFLDRVSIF